MGHRRSILAGLTLIGVIACQRESGRTEAAPNDAINEGMEATGITNARVECLKESALIYSDISEEPETGDKSGFEITLFTSADSITRGKSREASGELGAAVDLTNMEFNGSQGTLKFGIPNGPDTSRFAGRFSCDSIWGPFTAFRNTTADSVVFRRTSVR